METIHKRVWITQFCHCTVSKPFSANKIFLVFFCYIRLNQISSFYCPKHSVSLSLVLVSFLQWFPLCASLYIFSFCAINYNSNQPLNLCPFALWHISSIQFRYCYFSSFITISYPLWQFDWLTIAETSIVSQSQFFIVPFSL